MQTLAGIGSLSHDGAREHLWRDAQHKDGVPTVTMRGVVEKGVAQLRFG